MRIGIAGPISTANIAQFLHVNTAGLPRGYSGAPLLGTLVGALLKRGHEVVAFTTSSDIPIDAGPVEAAGESFSIYYCPARPRAFRFQTGHWGRAVDAFRLERNMLRQAMLQARPDVIHAHWAYEFGWAAVDSGLPHLVTCHDAPQVILRYMPNLYRLIRYFMARHVLAQAHHVTAVSPYLREKVERYVKAPVSVVPNLLPDGLTKREPNSRGRMAGQPRIAMVLNGWGKRKNPQPAFRAFALLRQRFPGAQLMAMGYDFGPGERAERWAIAHNLAAGIRFIGAVPYTDLLSNLANADVLLHPSLEETFGMSVVEAMALGVPVIGGARSGAVPWVIGQGGVLTDVTSCVAIEQALMQLLGNPGQYQASSEAAHARVCESFTAASVAEAYESMYRNIAGKGPVGN